ncbi:hypothetical protein ONE63_009525 [Megalurothrips usitatus]|uniref:PH domain-containing protein n=1 Tax=Megalurothrips usitatus TaxID=439358 RepID=A0AAV7XRG9_9NEOP|nr:hypothetical protein ONE63_009525 [Megalurothrips usitatus]
MNNGPEVVHEGWLIKSPPTKKIFRAVSKRWRRRWFVLRQSGELPGQYFLCYYTDGTCRKLKGQIDLDECEQVDTGLQFESSKNKYQHMFDVRTPKRIYYLAADTEDEMMKWVHNVCQVCGLKAYTPDEDSYNYSGPGEEEPSTPTTVITEPDLESPPVSPSSTTSAYIPISECITGPPLIDGNLTTPTAFYRASSQIHRLAPHLPPLKRLENVTNNNNSTTSSAPSAAGAICDEFYDLPRPLGPPQSLDLLSADLLMRSADGRVQGEWDAQKSPGTDADSSVFTDEEWTGPGGNLSVHGTAHGQRPVVNWETFPSSESEQAPNVRPSDSSVDLDIGADAGPWNARKRYVSKFVTADKSVMLISNAPPPPRPPKPSHLLLDPVGHNYLNIENVSPSPASHTTDAVDKHKIDNVSGSEPPSPLAISTPLDPALPGSVVVTDDMYDFPRSHQYSDSHDGSRPAVITRHCYDNAAPGQVNGDNTVFRYDFQQDGQIPGSSLMNASGLQDDEPTSPRSESSSVTSATQYSNLPSPHIPPSGGIPAAPAVDRGLKPRRKTSDSAASNEPSPSPLSHHSVTGPPSVDRKLKPKIPSDDAGRLKLCAPPVKRQDGSRSLRRAPGPSPIQLSGSSSSTLPHRNNGFRTRTDHYSSSDDDHRHSPDDDQLFKSFSSDHRFQLKGKEIKYLDLDHEQDSKDSSSMCTTLASVIPGVNGITLYPAPKSPEKATTNNTTVYKTVDFIKTVAFNRTRQEAEAEKKKKENG